MPLEQRITCDDGCGKARTVTDVAGTGWVHLVWYAEGGTSDLWFIRVTHATKWIKAQKDATPEPATPPAT